MMKGKNIISLYPHSSGWDLFEEKKLSLYTKFANLIHSILMNNVAHSGFC